MIVGIFLRYFKTYQGINYIPITDEDRFCGLVGENGIGKSSVLEALDCFFNGKEWNLHTSTKKSGITVTKPQIVPVFLVKKDVFEEGSADFQKASILSDLALGISEDAAGPSTKSHLKRFIDHRANIIRNLHVGDYFLLPIGEDYNGNISLSIFNTRVLVTKLFDSTIEDDKNNLNADELNGFRPILDVIKKLIEYIYIPRELDPEIFTKLETNEIQVLMGESLNDILSEKVTTRQINEINKNLNAFLKYLYSYMTP